jgi:hypothetical protein
MCRSNHIDCLRTRVGDYLSKRLRYHRIDFEIGSTLRTDKDVIVRPGMAPGTFTHRQSPHSKGFDVQTTVYSFQLRSTRIRTLKPSQEPGRS